MKKPETGKTYYLAGKMRGYANYNFPVFNKYADKLRAKGYVILNPAEFDQLKPWVECMRYDLKMIAEKSEGCFAIPPDWLISPGALLEVSVHQSLGLPVFDAETEEEWCEPVTLEAHRLVYGARQANYGHPLDDFTRTGKFWENILGVPVTPYQVGLCMTALKLSREVNAHKRDNLVDLAGYAETVNLIYLEEERRKQQKSE